MSFKPLQPLLVDDESGELAIDVYQPWCFPDNYYLAVTESQYMVMGEIINLYEDGEITEEQAKLCESAFALNSWTWADMPERNLPTMQAQHARAMLLKDEDDE